MVVMTPPALANLPSGRYAVAGSTWIKVPDDTRFDDLDKYMVMERKRSESPSVASERVWAVVGSKGCLLYTSPSPRDQRGSRMPSSA